MNKVMILITDDCNTHSYSVADGFVDIERQDDIRRNIFGKVILRTQSHYNFSFNRMKPHKPTKAELQCLIDYLSKMKENTEE